MPMRRGSSRNGPFRWRRRSLWMSLVAAGPTRHGCGGCTQARPQGLVRRKLVRGSYRALYGLPQAAGFRRPEKAGHRRMERHIRLSKRPERLTPDERDDRAGGAPIRCAATTAAPSGHTIWSARRARPRAVHSRAGADPVHVRRRRIVRRPGGSGLAFHAEQAGLGLCLAALYANRALHAGDFGTGRRRGHRGRRAAGLDDRAHRSASQSVHGRLRHRAALPLPFRRRHCLADPRLAQGRSAQRLRA